MSFLHVCLFNCTPAPGRWPWWGEAVSTRLQHICKLVPKQGSFQKWQVLCRVRAVGLRRVAAWHWPSGSGGRLCEMLVLDQGLEQCEGLAFQGKQHPQALPRWEEAGWTVVFVCLLFN